MKFVVACLAFSLCVGFNGIESAAAPGMLVYPWTEWLKLRATTPPPTPAPVEPELTQEEFLTFLSRSILPKAPKPKVDAGPTTKKPKLIDVGDFWAPPTIGPNMTSPEVIDPAFWAAKKTMFISQLFAAIAKTVLNSTGEVTTTTASPQDALLKQIDTVLLSDVARALAEDAVAPTEPSKALLSKIKAAMKKDAKKTAKKATTPKPSLLPFWAALNPTPQAEESDDSTTTTHPTLDYVQLAKALVS